VTIDLSWGVKLAKSGRAGEEPPGSNHTLMWTLYHDITGAPAYQGQPWCGASVICVLHHAGWTPPANWIGVYAIQAWGEAHKRWHRGTAGIKAGDTLVVAGPGVHTEVARSDVRRDGSVLTIGGNTSPGSEGSQFNGGTMALRTRSAGEVYGYVTTHDFLTQTAVTIKAAPIDTKPVEPQYRPAPARGALRLWMQGRRVAELQRLLGFADADADSYYGRGTSKAVAAFKKASGFKDTSGDVAGDAVLTALRQRAQKRRALATLKPGAKGGKVRQLQRQLIRRGFLAERTDGWRNDDGDYGKLTTGAVRKAQRSMKLPVTGIADARTRRKLAG
jgi:peptidoglycan hydrolase-like protein with peptidoglycan-binding domain